VKADLLVLATGYYSPQEVIRRLLGDDVATRIGSVWGIDSEGEMENMWKRTAQEGLWFMGGGLTQCRVYSLHLALQIKAIELGLISKSIT
jgi:putative flavoprotein involved in K+ transport